MPQTVWTALLDEGSTPTFTAQLVDTEDTPIGASQVGELWLTLYVQDTLAIINNRSHIDALNANGMTLNAQGIFTWTLSEEDMAVINPLLPQEEHIILREVHYTIGGVPHTIYDEVVLTVRNLSLVPYEEP